MAMAMVMTMMMMMLVFGSMGFNARYHNIDNEWCRDTPVALCPLKCILIVIYSTHKAQSHTFMRQNKKYCRILRHRALTYPASF